MNGRACKLVLSAAAVWAMAVAHPVAADERSEKKHSRAVLELSEVLQAAVYSFPTLISAELRKAATAGDRLAAEGGFDTSLKTQARWSLAGIYENRNFDVAVEQPTPFFGTTFFTGYRRGTGSYPDYEGKSLTTPDGEARFGFNIPLWRNRAIDRRRASLEQAKLGEIIAQHEYEQALLDVQRLAAQRYWDWVFAGQRLTVARELLGIAEQRDTGVRDRIELGDAPTIEGTDNRRVILERRERLVAAQRGLEQAGFQLSLYWRDGQGEPRLPVLEMLPDFPSPELPSALEEADAVERAHARRPELKRLSLQRQQAEVERDLQRNQVAPGIDVSVLAARDIGSGVSSSPNREELYAGITLDIPLQQRVATGRSQAAGVNVQRLAQDFRLASDRIAVEVRDAISGLKAAHQRVQLTREQLAMARQLEEAERDRFELGDSSILFVNLRELATGDAAVTRAEALATFFKAVADYRAALGDQQTEIPALEGS